MSPSSSSTLALPGAAALFAVAVVLCSTTLPAVDGLNVLVFLPGPGDAVRRPLNLLAEQLATRNHQVTTFRTEIVPEQRYLVMQRPRDVKEVKIDCQQPPSSYAVLEQLGSRLPWQHREFVEHLDSGPLWALHLNVCRTALRSNSLQHLADAKFDVALVYAGEPCFLSFVYALSVPFIYYDMDGFSDEVAYASGSPLMPDFIPSGRSTFSASMSTFEAAGNFWHHLREYSCISDRWLMRVLLCARWRSFERRVTNVFASNDEVKRRFKQFPDVADIKRYAAVYFVNSDPLVEFAGRVTTGRVVYVGGLGQVEPRPLPESFQMDAVDKKGGVIVVSFGNFINCSSMPSKLAHTFLKAFGQLTTYRVYWKVGTASIEGIKPSEVPSNVVLSPYLPQQDLLAAKQTRLLITHGGMDSVLEAVREGVPILGIPLVGSNYNNLRKVEARGMAMIIKRKFITVTKFYQTIKEMLENPSYRLAAEHLSRLFNDRPATAMDIAVEWTEYIGRHRKTFAMDVVPQTTCRHRLFNETFLLACLFYFVLANALILFCVYSFLFGFPLVSQFHRDRLVAQLRKQHSE